MNITQTRAMRTSSVAVLWLAWLVATTLGMIAGGLLAFPLGWSIGDTVMQAIGEIPALITVGLFMGGVLFGTIALAQAVVLRGRVPGAGRWVLFSTAAGALGMGVILAAMNGREGFSTTAVLPAVVFAIYGLWLGVAQWLVLRRHVTRAAWWVLISAAGLGLTLAVLSGFSAEGRELVSLTLSGILLGGITGAGMGWLLRDASKVSA